MKNIKNILSQIKMIGWLYNLEEVKKYIDLNNKKPSSTDINEKIKKLSTWIDTQQANYKNQNNIMINK